MTKPLGLDTVAAVLTMDFKSGTLELRNVSDSISLPGSCIWDERSACFRAPACSYADIVMNLVRGEHKYEDNARKYQALEGGLRIRREARPFQREAIDSWLKASGQGVVVLPTGSGKSHVALMAIDAKRRNTLVVAPTLDLVRQWYDLLRTSFDAKVGIIGGGEYKVENLTVTTYDSAYLHMEHIGNRFGIIIFDECHHLPSQTYALSAQFCLAPYRLGLSATPERQDGRHLELDNLIGQVVYEQDIVEMSGNYLAEYEVERVTVDLSPEEIETYEQAREIYRNFLKVRGIRMSEPDGWTNFVIQSSRGIEGRRAMDAYQRQRKIAFAAPSKLEYLEHLLHEHRLDRSIVFTQDNATAYEISKRFLIPVITHQTKITERSQILDRFKSGQYGAVTTSKVLNEGVDVPEANVAIVMSGSGSVREHVQRLGRVLRKKADGSSATLYELVAGGTSEAYTSRRRREHVAYR